VPRRAADLKQVLGDLPAEPQMSAFSFPGDSASSPGEPEPVEPSQPRIPKPPPRPGAPAPAQPRPPSAAHAAPAPLETTLQSATASGGAGGPPRPPPRPGASPAAPAVATEGDEWRTVYNDFVALKQQCGEPTEGFTYEKFEQTLKKNRDTLVQRHAAKRVKFSVYIKDGKAALKASPIKD
jgi:hypothetical protein